MTFNYRWKNKEANFGSPIEEEVEGGTHISFEIILKKEDTYIALRRPKGIPEHPPKPGLYFCHNLIRYGESMEECVKRIVKEQAGVEVQDFKLVYMDSDVKDNNWALTPHIIAIVEEVPQKNSEVEEVVVFDKNNIPEGFAWWDQTELKEFLEEYD